MTSGQSIASHGRLGKVSALSIASQGRLIRRILALPPVAAVVSEVMRLVSEIDTILNIESRFE